MTTALAKQADGDFLAAAIHDLRQPLHAISLFTSVLAEKARDPDDAKATASIEESLQTIEFLLHELLEVAKLDSTTIELQSFAIQKLFEQLHDELAPQALGKGLRLTIEAPSVAVYANPGLVERLLRNLARDAIHEARNGVVAVIATRFDSSLRVSVCGAAGGAIARRVCGLLGCAFKVESAPGFGSTFSFELPIRSDAALAAVSGEPT